MNIVKVIFSAIVYQTPLYFNTLYDKVNANVETIKLMKLWNKVNDKGKG